MAKDRRKVQHIHSSVFDKQPTPQSLELGELAVNANKNGSFISTKNSNNEVVRFSEDATIVDWMEYKEVFPYSATVMTPTEQDLKNNKSQLLFKINQVVPTKTPYGTDVNGAVDMHGDEINPISPDGTKDGAGFAVNMDMYAMQGSNPSFSSVTTSCGALLQGTTQIKGTSGSCGSLLDVDVTESHFNSDTFEVDGNHIAMVASGGTDEGKVILYGAEMVRLTAAKNGPFGPNSVINLMEDGRMKILATDNICEEVTSGDATFYGSENTNIGVSCDDTATAATTNIRGDKVIVDAGVTNLGLTAKEDILESAENDIFITANNVICETAGADVSIYGVESTNVGVNCSGSNPSTLTTINGETININSPITNFDGDVIVSGSVVVNDGLGAKVCSVYGDVRNENGKCSNLSGNTTTNFTIPNQFSHMKNHKNSDDRHETDYYTFEYPVEVSGTITANKAIYSSDIALKDNIRTVSRNDFNKVKRVNTKSFVFKDDPHRTKTYGVIAQEVEAAGLGELVYTKEDGFKAVDYTAFMMLKLSYLEDFCINLSMQNEELKKKIKDLENKK